MVCGDLASQGSLAVSPRQTKSSLGSVNIKDFKSISPWLILKPYLSFVFSISDRSRSFDSAD